MLINNSNINFRSNILPFPGSTGEIQHIHSQVVPKTPIEEFDRTPPCGMREITLESTLDALANQNKTNPFRHGRMYQDNGYFYSGEYQTTNKKGEAVKLEFKDGFITSSEVSGKGKKTYSKTYRLPREKGVEIKKYDEKGNIVSVISHFYDEKGRIKRTVNVRKDFMDALDFQNGKEIARTTYSKGKLQEAVIKNEKGQTVRVIDKMSEHNDYMITDFFDDDSMLRRVGKLQNTKLKEPATKIELSGEPFWVNYESDDTSWEIQNNNTNNYCDIAYKITRNGRTTTLKFLDGFNDSVKEGLIELTSGDNTILVKADNLGHFSNPTRNTRKEIIYMGKKCLKLLEMCKNFGIRTPETEKK